ncbi:MAG: hypothetical protein ACR2NU_10125 [Aeoliella sp.]
MEFLFFVIPFVLATFGLLAYYGYLQQKKRTKTLEALARRIGWRFDPTAIYDWDDRYPQFGRFRQGHSRYAHNTLQGELQVRGAPATAIMGDYTYRKTSGSGKSRSTKTYRFSYLMVHLPLRSVPRLVIRREGLFDGLASMLGFDDIDFESAAFSRRFHVKSDDRRFAYDVLEPKMMEFLMNSEPPAIEIDRGVCCIGGDSACWQPHEFMAHLDWMQKFFAHWPDHVIADLRSRTGS